LNAQIEQVYNKVAQQLPETHITSSPAEKPQLPEPTKYQWLALVASAAKTD